MVHPKVPSDDLLASFRGTPTHPELAFDETAQALARNGVRLYASNMIREPLADCLMSS